MSDTATQAQLIAEIAANLEEVRESLIRASSHITGLVQVGRATCKEIKTYNIWAFGLYSLQAGMLSRLREMGENVPAVPKQPTYFAWRGIPGQQAIAVDCDGDASQSLEGAFRDVLKGPGDNAVYLSLNEIEIVTQSPDIAAVAAAVPSWAEIQTQQAANQGLGEPVSMTLIVIAGISALIAAAVIVSALTGWFEVSDTNKTTSERNRLQSAAYEQYLKARLDCLQICATRGGSVESCTTQCKNIAPPAIGAAPGSSKKWGVLQWAGALTFGTLALWGAHRLYKRKMETGSVFPKLPEAWQLPD